MMVVHMMQPIALHTLWPLELSILKESSLHIVKHVLLCLLEHLVVILELKESVHLLLPILVDQILEVNSQIASS